MYLTSTCVPVRALNFADADRCRQLRIYRSNNNSQIFIKGLQSAHHTKFSTGNSMYQLYQWMGIPILNLLLLLNLIDLQLYSFNRLNLNLVQYFDRPFANQPLKKQRYEQLISIVLFWNIYILLF
eukprot:SAG31_NODE_18911_length_618_cov_1.356455_1_plen_125_part_00